MYTYRLNRHINLYLFIEKKKEFNNFLGGGYCYIFNHEG